MSDASPSRWWIAGILILTFGLHAPSIGNDFVFDDHHSAKATVGATGKPHEMIATLQPITVYFSSHYLRGSADQSRGFRPITVLSFALTFQLFSGKIENDTALPHHAINVALQTVNTWLVYVLLLALAGRRGLALLAGLTFGVNAVHSGAVASIVGRGELLAFFFGALAGLSFLRAMSQTRRRALPLVASSALLFLALCSKESAVSWVVLLPLLVVARRWITGETEPPIRTVVVSALGVGVVPVVLFALLYVNALSGMHAQPDYLGNPLFYLDNVTSLATATAVWVYAIYKIAAPFSLACDYGPNVIPLIDSFLDARFLGAAVLLIALVVVPVVFARRMPWLFLSSAVFFGFSFITSNIPFRQETIFAERLLYTPSLAVSLLVAGLATLLHGRMRQVGLVVLLVWCAACSAVTVHRMLVWKNNQTLFTHDVKVQPRSLRMMGAMVGQLMPHDESAAIRYYNKALKEQPDFPLPLLNLGVIRLRAGDYPGARKLFERGIASRTLHWGFQRDVGSKLAFNLGRLDQVAGQLVSAEQRFETALQWCPDYREAHYFVVQVQLKRNRLLAAQKSLQRALQYYPQDPVFEMFVGVLAAQRGNPREAAARLHNSLPRLSPQTEQQLTIGPYWLILAESQSKIGESDRARGALKVVLEIQDPPPDIARRIAVLRRQLGL